MQDPKVSPLEVLKLDKDPPLDDIERACSSLRLHVEGELKGDPRLESVLRFIDSTYSVLTKGKFVKANFSDSFTNFNRSVVLPEIPDQFKNNASVDRLHHLYQSNKKPSAYEVLGLAPGLGSGAIKKAWFQIAKDLHPDKGLPAEFRDLFNWAKAAHELLTNK